MIASAAFPFPLLTDVDTTTFVVINQLKQQPDATCPAGFTSPSEEDEILSPLPTLPGPHSAATGILLPSILSPPPPTMASSTSSTKADSSSHHPWPSSSQRHPSHIDPAFAAAIPDSFQDLPTPTTPQELPHRLQLPSFNALGIANPHPDLLPQSAKIPLVSIGGLSSPFVGSMSQASIASHTPSGLGGTDDGFSRPHTILNSISRGITPLSILTPPDEPTSFNWSVENTTTDERRSSEGAGTDVPSTDEPAQTSSAQTGEPSERCRGQGEKDLVSSPPPRDVLETAIDKILLGLTAAAFPQHSMTVLSHALPSPSIPGHCFPQILERLRQQLPINPVTWISLLHAVPGRFNLSDLPVSPPSTPGVPLGGFCATEDYFTTQTFESAVLARDYGLSDTATATAAKEHPLAPPCSVHLCVVERYIPPTSKLEYENLFSVTRPSLLVDRMVELVPGSGCLLFIYPTSRGANTFCDQYLGPVLDPLLRQMVVINNFTADLSSTIGTMAARRDLPTFATMRRKIANLCADFSSATNPQVLARLHREPSQFELLYAEPYAVRLDRSTWSKWWVKQEKTRVRTAVSNHFRLSSARTSYDVMPTAVIQEILEGVETREVPGAGEEEGIEVGVFVVGRGKRQ